MAYVVHPAIPHAALGAYQQTLHTHQFPYSVQQWNHKSLSIPMKQLVLFCNGGMQAQQRPSREIYAARASAMTVNETADWIYILCLKLELGEAHASSYALKFKRESISGQHLRLLTHSHLTSLSITDYNHQCMILWNVWQIFSTTTYTILDPVQCSGVQTDTAMCAVQSSCTTTSGTSSSCATMEDYADSDQMWSFNGTSTSVENHQGYINHEDWEIKEAELHEPYYEGENKELDQLHDQDQGDSKSTQAIREPRDDKCVQGELGNCADDWVEARATSLRNRSLTLTLQLDLQHSV